VNSDIAREMKALEDAHDLLDARELQLAASEKPYFEPTPSHPLRTVEVDATTGVFDYPKAVHLGEQIAKRGRKVGMKLQIVVRDSNSCIHDLGGSNALRSMAEMVEPRPDSESFGDVLRSLKN